MLTSLRLLQCFIIYLPLFEAFALCCLQFQVAVLSVWSCLPFGQLNVSLKAAFCHRLYIIYVSILPLRLFYSLDCIHVLFLVVWSLVCFLEPLPHMLSDLMFVSRKEL